MKVVINKCYGGFGVSDAGFAALISKGWTVGSAQNSKDWKDYDLVQNKTAFGGSYSFGRLKNSDPSLRSHPDLVAVVEELGYAASGGFARLEIVDIPDGTDFVIEEYDGLEHVAEAHRTWE